jgi:hypothetical protein
VARRIDKSVVLTKRDIEKADTGDFGLDRIALYMWEGKSGGWPENRSVHVQREYQLAQVSGNDPSLMALEFALKSFKMAVEQKRVGLLRGKESFSALFTIS